MDRHQDRGDAVRAADERSAARTSRTARPTPGPTPGRPARHSTHRERSAHNASEDRGRHQPESPTRDRRQEKTPDPTDVGNRHRRLMQLAALSEAGERRRSGHAKARAMKDEDPKAAKRMHKDTERQAKRDPGLRGSPSAPPKRKIKPNIEVVKRIAATLVVGGAKKIQKDLRKAFTPPNVHAMRRGGNEDAVAAHRPSVKFSAPMPAPRRDIARTAGPAR